MPPAKTTAVALLVAGLLLPAGVLLCGNAPAALRGWPAAAAPPPPYASRLRPLLAYLEGPGAARDAAALMPLAQKLMAARVANVGDARSLYAASLDRLTWPGTYTPAPPAAARRWRWRPAPPLEITGFVDAALSLLARESGGRLINCSWDATLPRTGAAARRVAVVSNLRQAGGVAPNAVLQLLRTVLWLPPGAAYVGVYEDGSRDDTRRWLALLQLLLVPLGVPHLVTLDGALGRRRGEQRIAHLSRLRNAVVDPLFDGGQRGGGGGSGGGGSSGSSGGVTNFSPDQVLFVNDVFWCGDDVARLLLHDADLACGYDAHRPGRHRRERRRRRRRLHGKQPAVSPPSPKPKAYWFYDIWVARDVTGARLSSGGPPFTAHPPSRARGLAGLPFPMSCCFNGAAKITAEAFRRGLRFRSHLPGECRASECSLLCDDMARVGLRRALLDPAVVVTYDQDAKAALYAAPRHWTAATGIAARSWRDVASAAPLDWRWWGADYSAVECCGLEEGKDLVDWDRASCHRQNVLATNYTAAWLQQHGVERQRSGSG